MPSHHWQTLYSLNHHTATHCNSLHHNTRAHYFAHPFQVWPPKSGRHSLIVLLMMGMAYWCPKHVEAIKTAKTAYFVASSRFFTFTMLRKCSLNFLFSLPLFLGKKAKCHVVCMTLLPESWQLLLLWEVEFVWVPVVLLLESEAIYFHGRWTPYK
jgi:hypothetical protein